MNNKPKNISTIEQSDYINFTENIDTKLIACAGSGKTYSIIARMDNLIKNNVYKSDEIMMLTFSRFTRDDFLMKIEKYNAEHISPSSIKTIDSYAKLLIDNDNQIDVSLLSYRFMKYLELSSDDELNSNNKLKAIKAVFIDEAQDLNEIQFRIINAMKQRLHITINLIGDPNQNIYQFRNSSDRYLVQFEARTFYLTRNFRSYKGVIEFSKHLRPDKTMDVICTKGDDGCKPIMILHNDESTFEYYICDILNTLTKGGVDLSDIAILAPTRGRMKGFDRSHGLCLVTNILFKVGIKFKQFYEEATDEVGNTIKYEPKKGYINVLTYMGSKGLEWKFVLVLDAETCLINKRIFTNEKHNNDQYLLYVACSRAIKNVFVFSRYSDTMSGLRFKMNPWFSNIPIDCYKMSKELAHWFKFPSLKFVDMGDIERRTTKIIDRMSEESLDILSSLIGYESLKKNVDKIYEQDYSNIENNFGLFFGRYVEQLFYCYYNIKKQNPLKRFTDIENIIENNHIFSNVPVYVADWFANVKYIMTWEKFDAESEILKQNNDFGEQIVKYIDKNFDRNFPFSNHTIINDGYYSWFIISKRKWIKKIYEKYLKCKDTKKIRRLLFFIMIVVYTFDTQHYFHVTSKGKKFKGLLKNFSDMFDNMKNYTINNDFDILNYSFPVSRWGIVGEIDFIDINKEIWEIKATSDITLKHILQILMYNLMYKVTDITDNVNIKLNFLNLLRGEKIIYDLNLSKDRIHQIKDIFVNTGKINIQN